MTLRRQARLRAEYAASYPGVAPGMWHDAGWLSELILQRRRRGTLQAPVEPRPLPDAHFEFQGQGPPGGPAIQRIPMRGFEPGTPERSGDSPGPALDA